jgi:trk system potassium uptake protein TrkA
VTGIDATNVLACKLSRHFGVKRTVCRVSALHFFSEEDGFPPRAMGIDHLIHPLDDCVSQIMGVVRHQSAIERFPMTEADVEICAFRVRNGSVMAGVRLREFPNAALLSRIRFSLVIRNRRLIAPTGDFVFRPGDEVYAAGMTADIEALFEFVEAKEKSSSVVIVAGASTISRSLVERLLAERYSVRVIEPNADRARLMMAEVGEGVMFIHGEPTENDVLEDAGAGNCHAFIGALRDDEDNILGCVLAKNLGARKVIAVTNKAEYVDIVPAMNAIDCGFSPRLVAVNSVLHLLSSETVRVHAILQRAHAYVYEFEVEKGAPVCGKRIADALPASVIISLVLRKGVPLPATGEIVLQEGDMAVVIARPPEVSRIESLLRRKRILPI